MAPGPYARAFHKLRIYLPFPNWPIGMDTPLPEPMVFRSTTLPPRTVEIAALTPYRTCPRAGLQIESWASPKGYNLLPPRSLRERIPEDLSGEVSMVSISPTATNCAPVQTMEFKLSYVTLLCADQTLPIFRSVNHTGVSHRYQLLACPGDCVQLDCRVHLMCDPVNAVQRSENVLRGTRCHQLTSCPDNRIQSAGIYFVPGPNYSIRGCTYIIINPHRNHLCARPSYGLDIFERLWLYSSSRRCHRSR